jgi:prepilin-type N-terminal cleavage/methylation domain-containing protein
MKNRKGFTLIELLAVILILAVIALIAIPVVNTIIKESRRGAFEAGANNIVGAVEDACHLQLVRGETLTTTYTFTNGSVSPSLNIKGELPKSGTITLDTTCNSTVSISSDKFSATKSSSETELQISDL